ncbi:MAG: SpoIIE family protein phosphatase [bacterium]|nr:SpoIIE family protein phosphatase [bacterium]
MATAQMLKDDPVVQTRELTVRAVESQLSRVRDFVTEICEEASFSVRDTSNTKLAIDEACTNVIRHAYDGDWGEIRITVRIRPGRIGFSIKDTGKNFDFTAVKDPDLNQFVEVGKKGGLGIFLINRLMDDVSYRSSSAGNELVLEKSSQSLALMLPTDIGWRQSLRFRIGLRATLGLFILMAGIGSFMFIKQTDSINNQKVARWWEKQRLAENVANNSTELLMTPEVYSVEQTNLNSFVTRLLRGEDLAYILVTDLSNTILASGSIEEIFTTHSRPTGEVILRDGDVVWTRHQLDNQWIRDIMQTVTVTGVDGVTATLGYVHVGVIESVLGNDISDPRPGTVLTLFAFFLVGVTLVMALVSVFMKPLRALADGVRAIGRGSFDGTISVEGSSEIGEIASVFNDMNKKFQVVRESMVEQEKLQKEIEVAKQIQQALLPAKEPDVAGFDIAPYYQAAKDVGGDYYDFVMVDEDTLGVVVADVSGKGVPGSLVMTMIRTALRMEARGNKNASDVISKINDFVTDDIKKGMFVTMFYIILDSKNRVISYASAGHNPMILYRHQTKETFFLNPKGFPVGISLPDQALFRHSINLEQLKLKKDDMLVVYTDGVTEAMNSERDQFGEERLIAAVKQHGYLPADEFIEVLEKEIHTFTDGNPQNDDITVVAVKEKQSADDVLFDIRRTLFDMVEVQVI